MHTMSRFFNTAGPCIPGEHYLLSSADRLGEIDPVQGLPAVVGCIQSSLLAFGWSDPFLEGFPPAF